MKAPERPNACWSLDFVHAQMTDGRRFRILAVVDDCTRECLALVPDSSISGVRVAPELDRIVPWRGSPEAILSDNGTELTSNAVLVCQRAAHRVALHPAGQAVAERLHRELQRQAQRRVAERDAVSLARARALGARRLAHRLQPVPSARKARLADAGGLRGAMGNDGRA
jgi:transposase InsO family protein